MKAIKEIDIARMAGVSRATVSRVLNGADCVLPETSARILKIARELGFRSLRQHNIGIVIYRNSEIYSYLAMALSQLRREIGRRHWRMELFSVEDLDLLNNRNVSGVINLSHAVDFNEKWCRERSLPLVNYYLPSNHLQNIYSVYTSGRDVMEKVIGTFWRNGHRRIGYLGDNSLEIECCRLSKYYQEFCAELKRRGVDDPEKNVACTIDMGFEGAIRYLIERHVTALFITNESFGPAAAQKITQCGVRIPQDISIVTHESTGVSQYLTPAQTTVCQDYPAMAFQAMEMLELMIHGKKPAGDVALPCSIIHRDSVCAIR